MLESISIKNVATFDETGVQINDLKKVNFFFGYNGSGKSTISKYLYNLSLEDSLKNPDFNDCAQNGYDKTNHQILTFDQNFTDVNFIRNPLLKGVFSLNQKNDLIDNQIKIEEKLIQESDRFIESKNKISDSIENDKRLKYGALLDYCWMQRTTFASFSKIYLIHPGSKPNHLQELKDKIRAHFTNVQTIEQLANRYKLLYETEISEIALNINKSLYKEIRIIEKKLVKLLKEIIIGNEDVDIADLINTLDARSWVETGVKFIDKTNGVCPFCQKDTINEELKKQFNEFFDLTYKKKIQELEKLQTEYNENTSGFLSNIFEIQKVFNPNNSVSNLYVKLQKLFEENADVIAYKIANANEKKEINSLESLKPELSGIIKSINQNNKTYDKLDDNKKTLLNDIWVHMASNCKSKIEEFDEKELKYKKIKDLATKLIESYRNDINTSKQKIETLRGQTINTKEAVDNINLILRNTGFEGFEIAEKETTNNISQYYLKRPTDPDNEQIFSSLSEGEKNFISFLYFYQLCIGTDDIQTNSNKKKIIVFDDPVSSLDCQALFVVSTLIHNLIRRKGNNSKPDRQSFNNESIIQVFILTHNLYFYKEVSFDKRPICTDWWHYKINKTNNKTSIKGDHNKTIFDDYTLLWNTIKEIKNNIPQDTSLNIVISNTMRRIIESYVNFIGIGKDSWGSVLSSNQDEPKYYIKCAFLSTINDESHKITALDSVYYQKIINEQPQILFDVFKEIFKDIGKEHYEIMMDEQF